MFVRTSSPRRPAHGASRHRIRLVVESLEDRELPSSLSVTSTASLSTVRARSAAAAASSAAVPVGLTHRVLVEDGLNT